ncbi:M23 family peptidase [Cryobacterium frigoriphilum]|uniref:M23 family peptidase n=1 Tax=Cryobacterium frigoriphilum TaxID=1259150 RepID=A0A4R9A9P8_9MICO|nr:M23 family metallopeptidase [Cryobacterium frigoriphilum]TFD54488.1 M23 family peptidase [Cryobacterium frigoriphilum]
MSAERDATPTAPLVPLTRRELREQERLATVAQAEKSSSTDAATDCSATLTADAARVVAAELNVPDLETPVLDENDRVIAAQGSAGVNAVRDDILLDPESTATSSTEIPLTSRADLRADRADARAGRPRRQPVATARLAEAEAPFAPTRRFVPNATPPAASARPVRAPVARVRRLATKAVTVAAMSFVALMAVATSLPAEALLSSSDVQTAVLASQQKAETEPLQTLDLAGGDTIMVERDGYESSTIADSAAASGIRMEDTFTNNPNGAIQWPFAVGVHIGDQFGYRNCAGCSVNHGGQDFNPGLGAPIQAISDGVVSFAEDGEGSLGVHMIIDHMIDGELVSSVYAHMIHGSMLFKAGDVIKVGQVIGKTGSTGMSTGPHLHFEIRLGGISGVKVDSLQWLYTHTD